ncbi:Zinc finger C2H2 type domain signature [Nakaseomyces glabratus]|nr:hypothetical protein LTX96_0002064 [Nakaseomyces glabratus]
MENFNTVEDEFLEQSLHHHDNFEDMIKNNIQIYEKSPVMKVRLLDSYIFNKFGEIYDTEFITTVFQHVIGEDVPNIVEVPKEIDYHFWIDMMDQGERLKKKCSSSGILDFGMSLSVAENFSFVEIPAVTKKLENIFWEHQYAYTSYYSSLILDKTVPQNEINKELYDLEYILSSERPDCKEKIKLCCFGTQIPWRIDTVNQYHLIFNLFGTPIQWYIVEGCNRDSLISYLKKLEPKGSETCNAFYIHKKYCFGPDFLERANIPYKTMVQESGKLFISKPGTCFFVFHYGYSIVMEKTIKCDHTIFTAQHEFPALCTCGKFDQTNTVFDQILSSNSDIYGHFNENLNQQFHMSQDNGLEHYWLSSKNNKYWTSQVKTLLNKSSNSENFETNSPETRLCVSTPPTDMTKSLTPHDIKLANSIPEFIKRQLETMKPIYKEKVTDDKEVIYWLASDLDYYHNSECEDMVLFSTKPKRKCVKRGKYPKKSKKPLKFKIRYFQTKIQTNTKSTFPVAKKLRLLPQPSGFSLLVPEETFLSDDESSKNVESLGQIFNSKIRYSDGFKYFYCEICDHNFPSSYHLIRHRNSVHSAEKPYNCPICSKGFKRKDHVSQHLKKKTPCRQKHYSLSI